MLNYFDSASALKAECIRRGLTTSTLYCADNRNGLNWFGYENLADTLRYAESGDTRLVARAETLIESLEQHVETPRRVWQPAPAGAFCVVPDHCRGLPTSMRRPAQEHCDFSPVNLIVCTHTSSGVSSETMQQRGSVILALVLALSRVRPITLITVSAHYCQGMLDTYANQSICAVKINTAPLDLATACYALTSAGYERRLNHYIAQTNFRQSGALGKKTESSLPLCVSDTFLTSLPSLLGMNPADSLVIKPAHLHDTLMQSDPVTWINNQVSKFAELNEF